MTIPIYHAMGGLLQRKGRSSLTPPASGPTARPTGTGYVRYEDLYVSGNTLRQVIGKVTNRAVLTLPEGVFTFSDFADPIGYFDGVRIPPSCGGIWGSGRNTVLQMVAGTSTRGSNTEAVPPSSGTNQCYLLGDDSNNNAKPLVLKNFTLKGTEQGHFYNGIRLDRGPGVVVDGLYLLGANPGNMNYPPGETFGINFYRSNNASLLNTEIDGRKWDGSGAKTCASPFGWNNCDNAYVENVYAHHARTGMPTFYAVNGVHTVGLRSEYNGSGSGVLSAAGINHENVGGTILHESPTLILDRASGNSDLHITLQNGIADNPNVTLSNVVHDAGPNTAFSVMISDSYVDPQGRAQKQTSLPTITKAGVTLAARDANAGISNPNPATQYFRYH